MDLDSDSSQEHKKTCSYCGEVTTKRHAKKCHHCHNFFYEYTTPLENPPQQVTSEGSVTVPEDFTSARSSLEQHSQKEGPTRGPELIPTVLSIIKMCGTGSPSDSIRSQLSNQALVNTSDSPSANSVESGHNSASNVQESPVNAPSESLIVEVPFPIKTVHNLQDKHPGETQIDKAPSLPQKSDNAIETVGSPQVDYADDNDTCTQPRSTGAPCSTALSSEPFSSTSLNSFPNTVVASPIFTSPLLQSASISSGVSQTRGSGSLVDLLPYVQSPLATSAGSTLPIYPKSYLPIGQSFPSPEVKTPLSSQIKEMIDKLSQPTMNALQFTQQQSSHSNAEVTKQRKRSPSPVTDPPTKKQKRNASLSDIVTGIIQNLGKVLIPKKAESQLQLKPKPSLIAPGNSSQTTPTKHLRVDNNRPLSNTAESAEFSSKPVFPTMKTSIATSVVDGGSPVISSRPTAAIGNVLIQSIQAANSEAPSPTASAQSSRMCVSTQPVMSTSTASPVPIRSPQGSAQTFSGTAKANYKPGKPLGKPVIVSGGQPIIPRNGGVYVSVLGRSVTPKTQSDSPVLGIAGPTCKSPTSVPADSESGNKMSTESTNGNKVDGEKSGRKKGSRDKKKARNGGLGGAEGSDEDKKKKRNNSTTSDKTDPRKRRVKHFSVRLSDCYLHHVPWGKTRVVLIVPSLPTGEPMSSVVETGLDPSNGSAPQVKSKGKPSTSKPAKSKKHKRDLSQPAAHIQSACFSVHDFHDKLLCGVPIESPSQHITCPMHWHRVLSRMGATTESSTKSTLISTLSAKRLLSQHSPGLFIPDSLAELSLNKLPKRRKVFNLSNVSPEAFIRDSNYLARIPYPIELPSPSGMPCYAKPPDLSVNAGLEEPAARESPDPRVTSPDKTEPVEPASRESPDPHVTSQIAPESPDKAGPEELAARESPGPAQIARESPDPHVTSQIAPESPDKAGPEEPASRESPDPHVTSQIAWENPPDTRRSSEVNTVSSVDEKSVESQEENGGPSDGLGDMYPSLKLGRKQKFCPDCGAVLAKRCRKCAECGKRFGVFTFGRKLCPSCGRCNRAKMTACFGCGHILIGPQVPPEDQPSGRSLKRARSDDDPYEPEPSKLRKEKHFSVSSSGPSSRRPSVADSSSSASEPVTPVKDQPPTTRQSKVSKFSQYQYGRVPWGEADVTCLIDENGAPNFCLPELCSKVLRDHPKNDVIDIVKDLNLPLVQGDLPLLKKLQSLGLHSNRSPVCRLIGPEEVWTLLDALQERVPVEVHQHMETIAHSSRPLLSPVPEPAPVKVPVSPGLVARPAIPEDEDPRLKPVLHQIECSDGQTIAMLRTWKGEELGSLTEIWRKYFPEVNRNHLTSVLNKLKIETTTPTGSQASVLRSASVISIRGHAGRLIKFELMQVLLDNLSIPLQIGQAPNSTLKAEKELEPPSTTNPPLLKPQPPSLKPHTSASRPKKLNPPPLTQASLIAGAAAQGKVLATAEDLRYAEVMRNMLQVVELSDIKQLLETAHRRAVERRGSVDPTYTAAALDNIHQRISSHRVLCSVLNDEIGYLNVTNHGVMSEFVRTDHRERVILQELDKLFKSYNLQLK